MNSQHVWSLLAAGYCSSTKEARRSSSGIRGTATGIAPGFSKTLSNGVTVAVSSVTKAVLDGPDWKIVGQPAWRADGQVLA